MTFNFNDQLFTEISPEQAAVVEGGLRVMLRAVRCIMAGDVSDLVYATFNGNAPIGLDLKFERPKLMRAGSTFLLSANGVGTNPEIGVSVRFYDKSAPQGKTSLGGFTIKQPGSGTRTFQLNGSSYLVAFAAFD